MKPSSRASGFSSARRRFIRSVAARTASGVSRSSVTPPTSDFCTTSGDRILTATGKPISLAIATASSGVAAARVGTVGMP